MPRRLNKKILIAEDEPFLRDILVSSFAKAGFEVFGASDGEEGVKVFTDKQPDLIIVDILMPKLDGLAMMRKIRKSSAAGAAIPIIILTNLKTDDELTKKAMKEELAYPLMVKSEVKIKDIIKEAKKLLAKLV